MMSILLFLVVMSNPEISTVNASILGEFRLDEYNRTSKLHLTHQSGDRVRGWLVQETKEDGGITYWYADVVLTFTAQERFEMVMEYRHGEKRAGEKVEVWEMHQRRDERGKLLENGSLKVFPDKWERKGPAKQKPRDKNLTGIS